VEERNNIFQAIEKFIRDHTRSLDVQRLKLQGGGGGDE